MRSLGSLSKLVVAGTLLLAACGGGGPTDPGDDGSNNNGNNGNNNGNPTTKLTATIDGQAWSAGASAATAAQFAPLTGGYLIIGTGSGAATGITLTLNFITKTGTYPLGVDGATVQGGFAGITGVGGGTWITPFSGAAGTVTITAITTTRIAGTFAFDATGSGGAATGTKSVTNGEFDVPLSKESPIAVLTDSMGSKLGALLNGQFWNAAIVGGQTTVFSGGSAYLSLSGINSNYALTMTIPKPSGAGTYQLSNNSGSILWATDPNAVAPAGAHCCYGILGDVGTITITSMTTTRIKGTFSALLRPQPGTAATGTLNITSGNFDVGLYHSP